MDSHAQFSFSAIVALMVEIIPVDLQSEAIASSRNHPFLVGLTVLPRNLQSSVSKVQGVLRRKDPRHIYHPADTLHITVKPLGSLGIEVNQGDLNRIKEIFSHVTSRFEPFEVTLEGLAVFPDVVYAKITDGRERIIELNKVLAQSLKDLVVHGEHEGDRMIPHVTLATFKAPDIDKLLTEVREADHLMIGRMTLDRVDVVKAFLYLYYGDESVRAKAFQRIEVFPFKGS